MQKLFVVLLVSLCVLLLGSGLSMAEEYRLGSGDVLSITVWGHEDSLAAKDLIIRPDGKIAFPLAGEVNAAGLTTAEVAKTLTQSLSEYIKDPQVAVNVIKFRTTRIYVLGEVTRPGMYEIEKQHRVLDAIGASGGYTKDAAKKSVFLIRGGKNEPPTKVNLLKLLKEGDMSQNYLLADGDVVYLSSSNRVDFARDVLPLLTGAYYITHYNEK